MRVHFFFFFLSFVVIFALPVFAAAVIQECFPPRSRARQRVSIARAAVLDSVAARTLTLNPVAAHEVICANAHAHTHTHTHFIQTWDYKCVCVCVCVCVLNEEFLAKKSGFFLFCLQRIVDDGGTGGAYTTCAA